MHNIEHKCQTLAHMPILARSLIIFGLQGQYKITTGAEGHVLYSR